MNDINPDLLGGPWAMRPRDLVAFAESVRGAARVNAAVGGAKARESSLVVVDGTAHIPIHGTIMRDTPDWFAHWGIRATSAVRTRALVTEAVERSDVRQIRLDIDSPGGSVHGLVDLADDIAAAAGLKRVTAHAPDLMASAAYWIGSQANELTAGRSAAVGSIGTIAVLWDYSKMLKDSGIKVHVISSHELKGTGAFGAEVTKAQLADLQREIDAYTDLFVEAVAKGRRASVDQARKVATGQVWIGQQALELGLIDAIAKDDGSVLHKTKAPLGGVDDVEDEDDEESDEDMEEDTTKATIEELQKRAEEAEARAAALDARNQAQQAALEAARRDGIEAIIAKHRDRIAPAAMGSVRAFAEKCDDLAEFERFASSLAVVPRVEPSGSGGAGAGDLNHAGADMTDEDHELAAVMGLSATDYDRLGKATQVTIKGDPKQ